MGTVQVETSHDSTQIARVRHKPGVLSSSRVSVFATHATSLHRERDTPPHVSRKRSATKLENAFAGDERPDDTKTFRRDRLA
jgi:hypothetical protein